MNATGNFSEYSIPLPFTLAQTVGFVVSGGFNIAAALTIAFSGDSELHTPTYLSVLFLLCIFALYSVMKAVTLWVQFENSYVFIMFWVAIPQFYTNAYISGIRVISLAAPAWWRGFIVDGPWQRLTQGYVASVYLIFGVVAFPVLHTSVNIDTIINVVTYMITPPLLLVPLGFAVAAVLLLRSRASNWYQQHGGIAMRLAAISLVDWLTHVVLLFTRIGYNTAVAAVGFQAATFIFFITSLFQLWATGLVYIFLSPALRKEFRSRCVKVLCAQKFQSPATSLAHRGTRVTPSVKVQKIKQSETSLKSSV